MLQYLFRISTELFRIGGAERYRNLPWLSFGKNAEIYTLDSFNISNIVTRFWVFIFYTLTTPINGTLKIPHLVFFEPFLAIDL